MHFLKSQRPMWSKLLLEPQVITFSIQQNFAKQTGSALHAILSHLNKMFLIALPRGYTRIYFDLIYSYTFINPTPNIGDKANKKQ